ncbi:MAG: glycosyltransferase [Gemmatimonadota bacterium]
MNPVAAWLILVLTAGVLGLLLPFASHRTHLLFLSRRKRKATRVPWPEEELPRVTVQVPLYNERGVVERVVDAACALDYPKHLLEVQILDDSTDETRLLAARLCALWRRRGVRVRHLRRGGRAGFKAGALAWGAARAQGEFFLVLDADFRPPPELIRKLLPPFRDRGVGMVQARWGHLNAGENVLTRAQSFLLDGHFAFEQGGRYAGDRFFNFNGTAGMWRRTCLEEAGGWQSDTLTEDLDLSYRAQMAGWRFVYLDDVEVPAEIPSRVEALYVQQQRWAQGGVETARKILPTLLRSSLPLPVKAEATVHLLGHLAHPLTVLLAVLLLPSAMARRGLALDGLMSLDVLVFLLATGPFLAFYGAAGRRRRRGLWEVVTGVPLTLAVGVGLSVPVSRAVWKGLCGVKEPFRRTPKTGGGGRRLYRDARCGPELAAQFAMAALMVGYLAAALAMGYWASVPFVLLFLVGFGLPVLEGLRGMAWRGLLHAARCMTRTGPRSLRREAGAEAPDPSTGGLRPGGAGRAPGPT